MPKLIIVGSAAEEARARFLEADPDGIEWKHQKVEGTDGRPRPPQHWVDAMLSLLGELQGFGDLVGRRVRAHLSRVRRAEPSKPVDAHDATTAALVEVLGELARVRDELLADGLRHLNVDHGVPWAQLVPQLVGQDWGSSSLTDRGVLHLCLRMWMRKAPSTKVQLERRCQILIRRDARAVHVRQPGSYT